MYYLYYKQFVFWFGFDSGNDYIYDLIMQSDSLKEIEKERKCHAIENKLDEANYVIKRNHLLYFWKWLFRKL